MDFITKNIDPILHYSHLVKALLAEKRAILRFHQIILIYVDPDRSALHRSAAFDSDASCAMAQAHRNSPAFRR
jgi:hypothetical protein